MRFGYDFRRIDSKQALTAALGIDDRIFNHVLDFVPPPPSWDRPSADADQVVVLEVPAFIRHDIPKKNLARGHRTVWEPLLTKSIYKALARRLENFFRLTSAGYPHDSAFGYRAGRNIRENAKKHSGNRFLLSVDIQDFFPSISRQVIVELFRSLGIAPDIADLLGRFMTIDGTLPLGLATSPSISNLIALPIDEALSQLAARSDATYSRYSDDMSFSSDGSLPEIADVQDILNAYGFNLASSKTRHSIRGQAHYVTGLSISDPQHPHVPRIKKRALRQELYYAKKYGVDDHFRHKGINDSTVIQQEVNRLDGMVKFVAHHEPRMGWIKDYWRSILRENEMKPSFTPRRHARAPFLVIIDEAEFKRNGNRVLALCLVVTQHVEKVVDETSQVLKAALSDLWSDGNGELLRKRGLHFTDATQDLRLAYIRALAKMPFEGYVVFRDYDDPRGYEDAYLSLLRCVIRRRLMAAESQHAHLCFEQNSKVSSAKIKQVVDEAFAELKASNNRRPAGVTVEMIKKPSPVLSLPDFLLGVLGQYLSSKPLANASQEPRERLMFERLRDKYRLIYDLSNNIEYSRRRLIEPWFEQSQSIS
ncbi:reverse transcriptase family protein [Agrobacterium rosae]|uniref:reverse transcriptase family protein n=1 Tax=Agrobacterium rosae TaxID=1972867 RepID=UPI002033D9CB|nr:reverse transcriptase family protein [Agrobacterium rosae]MCM2435848.1 RNA-directed DNA polymerase [Agrobacterium rosae]